MGLPRQLSFRGFGSLLGLPFLLLLFLLVSPSQAAEGYKTPAYMAGVKAYRQGDYSNAIRHFRQAIRQDLANTNAHYYLGLSLDQVGKPQEALAEYQQVIREGRERKLVRFAHERINVLASTFPAKDTTQRGRFENFQVLASTTPVESAIVPAQAQEQISIPLKNSQNALIVDASLTQNLRTSDGAFIIDTGATYTSISQQMAERLGLDLENCEKVLITTANGRIEVPKIVIETLNVNGLEAHNVEATVIPVRHDSSFSGLLGLSFIRQFVVTIDPQAGYLIFKRN